MTNYLRTLLLTFCLLWLVAAVLSYWFDPLGYFRAREWRSSDFLSDRVWGDGRNVSALLLPVAQAETLIGGNSRVGYGFDVADTAVREFTGKAYNLGISGASFDELDAYIRHAVHHHTPETIMLGLDLGQFGLTLQKNPPVIELADDETVGLLARLKAMGYALWSKEALSNILWQAINPHDLTLHGVYNDQLAIKRNREIGVKAASRIVEGHSVSYWRERSDWARYPGRMRLLGRMIDDACGLGIDVKLFISPLHVRQLLLMDVLNLSGRFDDWKRDLVKTVERYRTNDCSVILMDFSGLSDITREAVPPQGDNTSAMQGYLESSHYKPALGRKIVERFWRNDDASVSFGIALTEANIEDQINGMRDELVEFRGSHPELVAELSSIARNE